MTGPLLHLRRLWRFHLNASRRLVLCALLTDGAAGCIATPPPPPAFWAPPGLRGHQSARPAARRSRRQTASTTRRNWSGRWRPAASAVYELMVLAEREATKPRARGGSPASHGGVPKDDRGGRYSKCRPSTPGPRTHRPLDWSPTVQIRQRLSRSCHLSGRRGRAGAGCH